MDQERKKIDEQLSKDLRQVGDIVRQIQEIVIPNIKDAIPEVDQQKTGSHFQVEELWELHLRQTGTIPEALRHLAYCHCTSGQMRQLQQREGEVANA
ncbi:hypothetical protein ACHAPJ_011251 [Fusarium lateritium]